MAYVSLRQQPGPGGTVRQPGDHMPEADAWVNPKLWVSKGYVRWVPDADVVDGRWRDFEEFARSGAGGRALKALVEAKGAAPAKPSPKDERPVHWLPLLKDYLRLGYQAEGYEAFIQEMTARAERDGRRVEIREPTAEEAKGLEEAIQEREEAQRMDARTPPQQPVEPIQPPAPTVEPGAPVSVPPAAPMPETQPELALDQSPVTPVAPAPLPPIPPRKELETMPQPQLWELARAHGLEPEAGLGKGKLLKLLSK